MDIGILFHMVWGISFQKKVIILHLQSIIFTYLLLYTAFTMLLATFSAGMSKGYWQSSPSNGVATKPGRRSVKCMSNFLREACCASASKYVT